VWTVLPHTGRPHQIRRHFARYWEPLWGDRAYAPGLYGPDDVLEEIRAYRAAPLDDAPGFAYRLTARRMLRIASALRPASLETAAADLPNSLRRSSIRSTTWISVDMCGNMTAPTKTS